MKRYLTVVSLLLILFLISCQMPLPGPGEEGLFSLVANWGRTVEKTSDSEEGVFIHPTSDGGFVSLTETLVDNTERNIIANIKGAKLNVNGEDEWVFSPDLAGSFIRDGIFILPNPFSQNKRYLIGVQKINLIENNTNVELFYVDENGDEIWSMEYLASGRDLLTGAIFTSETTVMVYGSTNSADGVFAGKNQSSGYDGFVLPINTSEGQPEDSYTYDYQEADNGIKKIYRTDDSPNLLFVGEAKNTAGVQKIWLMRVYKYQPTIKSQALMFEDDEVHYVFGGLRRIGPNEYVMTATKKTPDREQVAFYKFTSDASTEEMNVEFLENYDVNKLIPGDSRERIIGLSNFKDGISILAGVKAENDVLTQNKFFLINKETFEVREQTYQYKPGVIYNHLSKRGAPVSYGLTGYVPSDDPDSGDRVAGGRACWVEGL